MLKTEQYANLLIKKLQVYFSCSDTGQRAYLYNFFGEIFTDPSVILDEQSYLAFVNQMEEEVNYAAQNNYYTLQDLYNSPRFNANFIILQNSFASIGITLALKNDSNGLPSQLVFTLPNGKEKIWYCQKYDTTVRVCAQLRVTDDYLRRMRTYYLLSDVNEELLPQDINVAGLGTKWEWDEEDGTVSVTGSGTLASYYLWEELGFFDQVQTLLVGAGITELTKESMALPNNANLVFLQSENAAVKIDPDQFTASDKEGSPVFTYHIFTNNTYIKNNDYGNNPNVTLVFHPLSDWLSDWRNGVWFQDNELTILGDVDVVQDEDTLVIT